MMGGDPVGIGPSIGRRFWPSLVLGGVLAVLVLAVFSGRLGHSPEELPPPVSPVSGVVTAVDAASLTDIRGFAIRTDDGQTIAFVLGPLENAAEFPPGHLKEHQATSEPVRVYFREQGLDLVAYRLEDASAT
jgi:hypothetical protein